MKILVAVKRVVDADVRVRVKADNTGVETTGVKMSINPFDEIAVEAALCLKEQGLADEVVVVSVGDKACQDVLRHALALGADRGILIEAPDLDEPIQIAESLTALVKRDSFDLVILGKQAIDNDCSQTGQMLAALLAWPQATFISDVSITDSMVHVTREIDGGLQKLRLPLPAILTSDLRLNQPRYATLPNIMKSKSKKIDICTLGDLSINPKSHTKILFVEAPHKRKAGVMVDDASALVAALKERGVIA
jgi:electron transfer flavoprotein beta subunit